MSSYLVDFPIAGMAGDVNLYWNDVDEPNTVEIEIMVAEAKCRRKGVAYEALTIFMAYAVTELVSNLLHIFITHPFCCFLEYYSSIVSVKGR
jgi:hypothetical protein